MPSTTYNIDRILKKVSDESRETIREVLDEIQLIVYSQDCLQTMKLTSTGMPPFIATQQGVYEYECPADCRKTASIFTLSPPKGYNRQRPVGPRKEYYFRNKGYYLLSAEGRDATLENAAKLYFHEDPGTTTEQYYHAYYIKPTRITDESIELTLPEEVHYLLRNAVVAMFTTEQYGQSAYDDAVIEKVARKIRNKLNGGYVGNAGMTPIQEEYQDYPEENGYHGWR